MFNLYNICLLRAFEHIHMEFARYKCLLLLLLLLLCGLYSIFYVLLRKQWQNVQNLTNFNVTRRDANQIS